MKLFVYFAMLFTIVFGAFQTAEAQSVQRASIKINNQKRFSQSKLTVKFVSLVEDSRCPQGVDCIWAGNAKIKVEISNGRSRETFEINTNVGARGAQFGGYAINLTELTPYPRANARLNRYAYKATFEIRRLTR